MGAGTSPADRAAPATGPAAEQGEEAADAAVDAPAGGTEGATGGNADGSTVEAPADGSAEGPDGRTGSHPAPAPGTPSTARRSRRFPSFTRDTARPEGGGRAAAGDAPAPARQWPLISVLCTAGAGLLIVATDPFAEAFRIGTILIGVALIGGAVLRLVVPSVGMLAVRSRFTDLVTYGLLGILIVMLSLMAQPQPWLDIPFLEDAVHFTIR